VKTVVHIVGAGPGDPGLITRRGLELINTADVIVLDALVNPALLRGNPTAEIIYVGKRGPGARCGAMLTMPQPQINRLLIKLAKKGRRVVRLKGGDPFVFGRGGEEMEALRDAGLGYEIVPGVSSAIAAPAYAGIPVSDRRWASHVTFLTGHEGRVPDYAPRETLVVLMGVAAWPRLALNLAAEGWPARTTVAAVESGTTREQRVLMTTLKESTDFFKKKKLEAPTIVVVGDVARHGKTSAWLSRVKPLLGRTVVVTRAEGQNDSFAALLRDKGADVIECPAIDIQPLEPVFSSIKPH
jgi:uroporphyrinogen III methyltransferase/synthase